ncbi:MAG: helix-turn-helix domain-containing protein [Flavobacteriaceae bacterium]
MPKVKLFDEKLILEKAMELFWKKGFHATSIQDLVTYLGISRSSIYGTYGGKNELFYKSFQHYRTTNITGFSNFINQQKNVKKGLRKLFKMAIEQSVTDKDRKGCFVVNTTTELVPGDVEILTILKENENTFVNIFYEFLLKGEQSGEISNGKNLNSIANLYYTLYNGIKVVSKVQPNSKELLSSVDSVLSLLD